jgi:hypothetical protein
VHAGFVESNQNSRSLPNTSVLLVVVVVLCCLVCSTHENYVIRCCVKKSKQQISVHCLLFHFVKAYMCVPRWEHRVVVDIDDCS